MTPPSQDTGVIVVAHGTRDADANGAFEDLVARVESRLPGVPVLPAHLSMARPNLADQVAALAGRGIRQLLVYPFFLHASSHVRQDLPSLLEEAAAGREDLSFEILPGLQGELALEDLVVERLLARVAPAPDLPRTGAEIEALSHRIIDRRLERFGLAGGEAAVIRRIVHATADFGFAESLRIHPQAVERAVEALRDRRPIVCDVRMVAAGITRTESEVLCAIDDPSIADEAKRRGVTRATVAIDRMVPHLAGAVVAVGNAPTALWRLMEIAREGGPAPAVVVGLPVGFVGARESKLALLESGLIYVTNTSPRGGSPVAAAAVNALALLARER